MNMPRQQKRACEAATKPQTPTFLLVLGALALLLPAGCSTQTKRYLLNVFFEGVPSERTNGLATANLSNNALHGTNAQSDPMARPAESPLVVHAPYADLKCAGCHESAYSQNLRANLGDACLNCHKTVLSQGKSWHAPAASGDCNFCHEPHQSTRKALLKQPPNLLCAQCHESAEMAAVTAHKGQEKVDCTTCHHPHQSEGKFLLRNESAATDSRPALHSPGEGGLPSTHLVSIPAGPSAGLGAGSSTASVPANNAASGRLK